ncbi:hypothetical protein PYW07_008351 [Mythimna separata]|uniref:Phospholipase A2 n=1 Tax=Mythimna separata TaxID=271217 RepID=A0AAD8DNX0_MYTSE|nr:hypothetical protein PYW07_008351 [Mythimna separata]
MPKVILFLCVASLAVDSYYCWITDINTKMLSQTVNGYSSDRPNDEMENDESDGENRINLLIFPGTKWCGPGNVADNYDDLGVEAEADACCRDHDHCPDLIPGGESKHNLTNESFYTRLNCSCDDKFHDCLKSSNTKTAKYIGVIYFNTLQTKCFRKDYPTTECIKKGGWFKTKCLEYAYNTTEDKQYQWFDVQDF